ncbi:MAG: FAD-binding oxidoreductase [Desulfarculus sp.]|jgi:glycolate oxidase|nr:MAG: FAD-binding oxidoreductase [Desulfarculus sp.]
MSVNPKKLHKALAGIVGGANVFTDPPTNLVYAKDVMPYDLEEHNIPYAVVRPAGSAEIGEVLKYANQCELPVHIHGSGTSLVGLARPKAKGIVLDTARLQEIEIFPERGYFEAGAGVHLAKLRKALAPHKALLPIFPGSELVATIGGSVAVNTSAHAVDAALGKPGDYVLGLEAVLPTGEVIQTGTHSLRKPAGVEATKLLVGSEGLLGVITKLRMRLVPAPHTANLVAYYRRTEDILRTVMAMYGQGLNPPMFFEYLDEESARIGFEAVGLHQPRGAVAMMSLHAEGPAGCREKAARFLEFLRQGPALEAHIVEGAAEWDQVWSSRAEAGNYVYRRGSTFGSEVTPRVDKLEEAFQETRAFILNLESYPSPQFISFGHIGAPTIHGYAFIPTKDIPSEVKKAITLEVREKSEAINVKYGGCGGEWGLTAQRASFLRLRYGQAYYQMLVNIKKALDPKNILNRGNLEGLL